ncbi:MAG: protein-glutamate O-methyltransferase CheR [Chloroflexota bacterium]|nr:protein-glutamate O-methyltransferase CheR [Chloroflexota bacterium]
MSSAALSASLRAAYLRLLEQQFGLRPVRHADQVDGVVMQLLATSSYTQPADLYTALAAGLLHQLLEMLAVSLTVGETHFFRVTPQIDALRRVVLPELIARHQTDRRIRLWSAGCSTGEEPYTLAILLRELIAEPRDWDIQLVASDLNPSALEVARQAVYGEWSFRDSPSAMRSRYFTPAARGWRLNDEVRRMVRFARLNLAEDPFPFAADGDRIDLILCRNVTIYFVDDASQRLYARLADAMEPTGWLLLGPSDPVPAPASKLEVVAFDGALLWRRRVPAVAVPSPQPTHAARLPMATAERLPAAIAAPLAPARPAPGQSMDPLVHLHAGMARLDEGAVAAAINSLRRAAYLDGTSALVQFSLGRAYRELGDPARSRSAFSLARRLLAGLADDQPLTGGEGEVVAGELRHAVDAQLHDLNGRRP